MFLHHPLHSFAPFGARGIFNGASLLFFSYVGFDAIATTAEEVKNPGRDIPIGVEPGLCCSSVLLLPPPAVSQECGQIHDNVCRLPQACRWR
jgi:amino acid transporter